MSDRPTREECIRFLDRLKTWDLVHSDQCRLLLETTIHYLTEAATPDMFAEFFKLGEKEKE